MKLQAIFLILILCFLVFLTLFFKNIFTPNPGFSAPLDPPPTPTPTPVVLKEALPQDAYTIILVGDSMTAALGPNSDKLSQELKARYPGKTFGIFNLAEGSTNLSSVESMLETDILNREFEVILIESFGYNPFSDLPLDQGLKKQTETLDKIVETIRTNKTNAKVNSIIVFVATIAPNKDNYGKGTVDLTPEKRAEWASERSAYIKNHMDYAKKNNIPLIDIYTKSLDKEGITGDLQYIEGGTYIHPSQKGIDLISKEIADSSHKPNPAALIN